jgi:hypothetical protein
VEVYPDELAGVREAKAWAVRRGQSFRELVLEALRDKVAEFERGTRTDSRDGTTAGHAGT